MTYRIAVASGKGGTGKTTVSVNLYKALSERFTSNVQLVDCDVEEPNDLIFFPDAKLKRAREVFQSIPVINEAKCTFCKKCSDFCEFNAISVIPDVKFIQVNESLCHSCGACLVACSDNAITEKNIIIGSINSYKIPFGKGLVEGRLSVGSAMQTMVIKALKKKVKSTKVIIYDVPPGTSCSVVESVSGVNYVVLVSEPTPFGLYDLKLMVELLRNLNLPFGVVINKSGLGNNALYDYLNKEKIEILGEIPFDENYAKNYASGNLLSNIPQNIEASFNAIVDKLKEKMSR